MWLSEVMWQKWCCCEQIHKHKTYEKKDLRSWIMLTYRQKKSKRDSYNILYIFRHRLSSYDFRWMWMLIVPDSCFCSAIFLVVSIDHQSLILQELYHLGPNTLTSYHLCHPAPGLPMVHPCSRWSFKRWFSPFTCLVWAWSVFSQYLQGKEKREDMGEHHRQSHHPSVFAGFFY